MLLLMLIRKVMKLSVIMHEKYLGVFCCEDD